MSEVMIDLGRYCLRSYRPADALALARAADNPRVAETLRDRFPQPYTEVAAREWIAHALSQTPQAHLAIANAEGALGAIGLDLHDDVYRKSAELGYWLGEEHWGRGIATLAVRACVRHGFESFDLERIHASVFASNPASARVLEKSGFQLEGCLRSSVFKSGRLLDQSLYSILRAEVR